MMRQSNRNGETGVRSGVGIRPDAPDLLIHLHIAKTGGTTLSSMVKHAFRGDEVFETIARDGQTYGGLDLLTYDSCQHLLRDCDLGRLRYFTGHVPMGVHRMFARRAKYIAIVRHPVSGCCLIFITASRAAILT